MKKYFIFAAIAAAGLFASCSSDDIASNDVQGPIETPDGRVAIQVGVGAPGSTLATRGTGTAGGTGATGANPDPNIWRGERVNVLMYQLDANKLPTFNFTQSDLGGSLYENTVMVTPLEDENTNDGIAKEPTNAEAIGNGNTYQVKYYPADGNVQSDFWGYYLGGYATQNSHAADAPAGNGTLKMYKDAALGTANETADEAEAKVVATDFVINGTHDLLVGQAVPADLTAQDGHQYSYSAKAARQGIQPNIIFKHLLSRLQFKVKPGKESAAGVKVTGIKVHSKQTGDVIVAYKYKDATSGVQEPTRIVWDEAEETLETGTTEQSNYTLLPALELKRRITNADITASSATYAWVASDQATYDAATTTKNDVETVETTIAAAIAGYATAAAAINEGQFVRFYKNNDGAPGYQAGTGNANDDVIVGYAVSTETAAALVAADEGKMLALAPVTLEWDNTNATPATYAWVASDQAAYDAATTATKTDVATAAANIADAITAYGTAANAGNEGNFVRFYTDTNTDGHYDSNDGDQIIGYAISTETAAATGGTAVSTKVGEALLVAPQAKYWIEVDYSMDKKTARKWYKDYPADLTPGDLDGDAAAITGTLKADLIRTGSGGNQGNVFTAGESYLITVTLYGPEEIVIKTTLTAWTASDDDIEIGED